MRVGPSFINMGKAVFYPASELDRWDNPTSWFADHSDLCRWRDMLRPVEPDRYG